MAVWTIYREDTGELLRTFEGPDGSEWAQLSAGEALYTGALDLMRQRIVDGKPAEYRPAKPEPSAQWDEAGWRWITKAERNRPKVMRIHQAEAEQGRALREVVLELAKAAGIDASRLEDIEQQIEEQRGQLER